MMNVRQEALTEQEWWHIIYCDRASWSKITVIDSQKWSFVTLCLCFRAHFKILQKGGGGKSGEISLSWFEWVWGHDPHSSHEPWGIPGAAPDGRRVVMRTHKHTQKAHRRACAHVHTVGNTRRLHPKPPLLFWPELIYNSPRLSTPAHLPSRTHTHTALLLISSPSTLSSSSSPKSQPLCLPLRVSFRLCLSLKQDHLPKVIK